MSDFKTYHEEVVSVLQQFDKSKEWADLIRCLQKLRQTISKFPQFTEIPEKLIIAKRLSQCLNPALPSGVHLKAINLYEQILEKIGDKIVEDGALFAQGLFPLVAQASMQVKPAILSLVEQFYVNYVPETEVLLPGLLTAILPCLEETGSGVSDTAMRLLSTVSNHTALANFLGALWKAVLLAPSMRGFALQYLLQFTPSTQDEARLFYVEHGELVCRAICSALREKAVLTQRLALDVCLQLFPYPVSDKSDSEVVGFVLGSSETNAVELCETIVRLLTRKEFSLSRRIFAWVLGSSAVASSGSAAVGEDTSMTDESQGLAIATAGCLQNPAVLVAALRRLFCDSNGSCVVAIAPYAILAALCDRPEIRASQTIIEPVLLDVLLSLNAARASSYFSHEISHAAMKLFASISYGRIWKYVAGELTAACEENSGSIFKLVLLVDGIIDVLPLRQEDTQASILPEMFEAVLAWLRLRFSSLQEPAVRAALHLCVKFLGALGPRQEADEQLRTCFRSVESFFCVCVTDSAYFVATFEESFKLASLLLLSLISRVFSSDALFVQEEQDPLSRHYIKPFYCSGAAYRIPRFLDAVLLACSESEDEVMILSSVGLVFDCVSKPLMALSKNLQQQVLLDNLFLQLVSLKLWDLMEDSHARSHFEAAQRLIELSGESGHAALAVSRSISIQFRQCNSLDQHIRFSRLWRLGDDASMTSPEMFVDSLFQMLDSLNDDRGEVRIVAATWLRTCIMSGQIGRVMDPLLLSMLDPESIRSGATGSSFDELRVDHVLELFLRHVFPAFPPDAVDAFMRKNLSSSMKSSFSFLSGLPISTYLSLLTAVVGHILEQKATIPRHIRANAAQLLRVVVMMLPADSDQTAFVGEQLVDPLLRQLRSGSSSEEEEELLHVAVLGLLLSLISRSRVAGNLVSENPAFVPAVVEGTVASCRGSAFLSWLDATVAFLPYLGSSTSSLLSALIPRYSVLIGNFQQTGAGVDAASLVQLQLLLRSFMQILSFCFAPGDASVVGWQAARDSSSMSGKPMEMSSYDSLFSAIAHQQDVAADRGAGRLGLMLMTSPSVLSSASTAGAAASTAASTAVAATASASGTRAASAPASGVFALFHKKASGLFYNSTVAAPFRLLAGLVKDAFGGDAEETARSDEISPREEAQFVIFTQLSSIFEAVLVIWQSQRVSSSAANDARVLRLEEPSVAGTGASGPRRLDELHARYSFEESALLLLNLVMRWFPVQLVASVLSVCSGPAPRVSRQCVIEILNILEDSSPEVVVRASLDLLHISVRHSFSATLSAATDAGVVAAVLPSSTDVSTLGGVNVPAGSSVMQVMQSSPLGSVRAVAHLVSFISVDSLLVFLADYVRLCTLADGLVMCFPALISCFRDVAGTLLAVSLTARRVDALENMRFLLGIFSAFFGRLPLSIKESLLGYPVSSLSPASASLTTLSAGGAGGAVGSLAGAAATVSAAATSALPVSTAVATFLSSVDAPKKTKKEVLETAQKLCDTALAIAARCVAAADAVQLADDTDAAQELAYLSHNVAMAEAIVGMFRSVLPSTEARAEDMALSMAGQQQQQQQQVQVQAQQQQTEFVQTIDDPSMLPAVDMAPVFAALGKRDNSLSCTLVPLLSALRAVSRKDIFEQYLDPSFFARISCPETLLQWTVLLDQNFTADRQLFSDLLGRLSSSSATGNVVQSMNPFSSQVANGEHRMRMLHRVAFVLFSGRVDRYLSHLQSVLEKLAETLKLFEGDDDVTRGVLFCFRMVVLRVSPSNLAPFWPTILGELQRIFQQALSAGSVGEVTWDSRQCMLLLEALKFINFAAVVIPEEFSTFDWTFIDGAYAPPKNADGPQFVPLVSRLQRRLPPLTPAERQHVAAGVSRRTPLLSPSFLRSLPIGTPRSVAVSAYGVEQQCRFLFSSGDSMLNNVSRDVIDEAVCMEFLERQHHDVVVVGDNGKVVEALS